MSQQGFQELIKSNKRDTSQLKKEGNAGKTLAGYNTTHVKSFYSPVHYKGANAPFTEDALKTSVNSFKSTPTKSNWNMIRSAEIIGPTYIFSWYAKFGTGLSGKQAVNEASRKHIPALLEIMGKKPEKGGEKIVGGHVEASAFLSILRKALHKKVINKREAEVYLQAFLEGDLDKVMKTGVTDKSLAGKNVKTVTTEEELGMTYEEFKKINEKTHKVDFETEVMIPIPAGFNQTMANEYEKGAIKLLKAELNNLASVKWLDQPGSLSIINMYQEVIAAKLLGKKAPRYTSKNRVGNKKGKAEERKGNNQVQKGKKGKRQQSQVERTKLHNQLRNAQGQFANPTALRALLNKKLPSKLMDNMGHPSLENITGRFAQSAKIVNITQGKGKIKIPTIQYTYDTDPYQVFETGGKGDVRWATAARDPRFIINATIREIATEMMIAKFNTQRL